MDIKTWQQKAHKAIVKRRGPKDPVHHLLKLMEEVGELAEAHNKEYDDIEIAHEAADVLFALVCYCESMGIDLDTARADKYQKLKQRWGWE